MEIDEDEEEDGKEDGKEEIGEAIVDEEMEEEDKIDGTEPSLMIGIIGESTRASRVLISTSAETGTFTQQSISISMQSSESYFANLSKENIPEARDGCCLFHSFKG